MHFKNLEDKCNYYRSLTDYRVMPNTYVIAMLDGRAFSRLVKNKYNLPFDDRFIGIMNDTAKYLLENIQGAKFAYVQSDEISILITDFDDEGTDSFFGYRLCKMQSLLASMAASRFNQLSAVSYIKENAYDYMKIKFDAEGVLYRLKDAVEVFENQKLAEFDCKVWAVPDANTAFCHFLWRQNDCTRNSMQQTAQTFLSHKQLIGKTADEQIAMCREEKGVIWEDYPDGKKYGRLLYREEREKEVTYTDKRTGEKKTTKCIRNEVLVHDATPFATEGNVIRSLIPQK